MQAFIFSMKQFVKNTMGITIKGSCSAGTGAMDGVDRWVASTDVTPRNNGAAGSQAWVVWTDGNGVDVCLSYNSAADEKFRFAVSSGGLYVAAGTANQQPTATDEMVIWASASLSVITGTSGTVAVDRVWHMWGSSDKKVFRCAMYRAKGLVSFWGVEQITSSVLSPATFSPSAWTFAYVDELRIGSASRLTSAPSSTGSSGGGQGLARIINAASTSINATIGGGGETIGPIGGSNSNTFGTDKPALQGTQGHLIIPLFSVSANAGAEGELGTRIDWWAVIGTTSTIPLEGEQYGGGALVAVGHSLHPWDSKTMGLVS